MPLSPDQSHAIELGALYGVTPSTQRQVQLVAIHRRTEATIGRAKSQIEALNPRTGRSRIMAAEVDPHLVHPINSVLGSQLALGSHLDIVMRTESGTWSVAGPWPLLGSCRSAISSNNMFFSPRQASSNR
nr:hypothetical protein [Halochromatium roseum]